MDKELLYGLSHDLSSLIGSSKVFVKDLDNPESINLLNLNIKKLDNIAKGLSRLSKIYSENKWNRISIRESIIYVVSKLKNIEKNCVKICGEDCKNFYTIPVLLEEAVFQALHNAVTFSQAQRIEIDINLKNINNNFCIEIIDSCNRIPDDQYEFVFGPLKILEKRNDLNCGLGLYIAKTAISRLDGKIFFEQSNKTEGNKLVILIPYKEE